MHKHTSVLGFINLSFFPFLRNALHAEVMGNGVSYTNRIIVNSGIIELKAEQTTTPRIFEQLPQRNMMDNIGMDEVAQCIDLKVADIGLASPACSLSFFNSGVPSLVRNRNVRNNILFPIISPLK